MSHCENLLFDNHRSYIDPAAQNEYSDVMRSVHAFIARHSLPWDHDYIQCELESTMYSIGKKVPYAADGCLDHLPDHIDAIEGDLNSDTDTVAEDDTATIHFSPPSEQYAKEVYYPPMKRLPSHV